MGDKLAKFSDKELGPCMAALTERQRGYVRMFIAYGQPIAAARAAGYGGTHPQSVRNAASRMANDPRIKAALREYAEAHLSSIVPLASHALENILLNPAHGSHYKAVERVLNQAGMVIATKHEVDVVDYRAADELKAYIAAIAEAHGMDVKKILGASAGPKLLAGQVIDVVPTQVDPILRHSDNSAENTETRIREEWEDE